MLTMDFTDYNSDRLLAEYRHLLLNLKQTAEALFLSQVCNVWNVYGGLNRLHNAVENIFKHGTRVYKPDGSPDSWLFIEGLKWINPSLALNDTEISVTIPYSRIKNDKALSWLYQNLENHTLSQKLSWLISDKEHLASCFEKTAYLCQEKYSEATLICLRAVEQNQPSIITDIDPYLFLNRANVKQLHKSHRRCSSYPEFTNHLRPEIKKESIAEQVEKSEQTMGNANRHRSVTDFDYPKIIATEDTQYTVQPQEVIKKKKRIKHRKNHMEHDIRSWSNFSIDSLDNKSIRRNKSISLAGDVSCLLKQKNLKQKNIALLHCEDIKIYTHNNVCETNICDVDETPVEPDLSQSPSQSVPTNSNNIQFFGQEFSASSSLKTEIVSPISDDNVFISNNSETGYLETTVGVGLDSLSLSQNDNNLISKNMVSSMSEPSFTADENISVLQENQNNGLQTSNFYSEPHLACSTRALNKTMSQPVELKTLFSCFPWEINSATPNLTKATSKLSLLSNSAPGFLFMPRSGEIIRKPDQLKTFIEDGGSSIPPMASGFFPKPQPGESLLSFLKSSKNIRTNAELDRENAHFRFSEAMIAAVEQLKYNKIQRTNEEIVESDEEINNLKQRIRLRRRQKLKDKAKFCYERRFEKNNDSTTESISPMSTSDSSDSESDSIDLDIDSCSRKIHEFEGMSVSLGSLYSSTEITNTISSQNTDPSMISNCSSNTTIVHSKSGDNILSAECVALSLLSRFNEEQLPKASDLVWLVSEQDTPQSLLPLPGSWPVSPSEKDSSFMSCDSLVCDKSICDTTPLRGTEDWAPPRAQVIFTPHQPPTRKKLLANQNYRCAGCSMRVAARYGHKFRYCEYLGKLFCTGCHSERLAIIPGRVLNKWDFKRYQVSNFSYRLLERMWNDPLFRVDLLAPGLYSKIKALSRCKAARLQLSAVKEFVLTCRFSPELHKQLINEQSHIYNEPDVWSMNDFVQVKSGELLMRLSDLVKNGALHVSQCELCIARGFVCEVCCKDTIFPWQKNISRCEKCGSCYHLSCWNKIKNCSKCIRIDKRKANILEVTQVVT